MKASSTKTGAEASAVATAIARPVWFSPSDLKPSPENTALYNDDAATLDRFAENIKQHGLLEPLVITQDGFIVSGHRRHAAAIRAGLERIPCRKLDFRRSQIPRDKYLHLLREFNRQRSKSIVEIMREAALDANPEAAYTELQRVRDSKLKGQHTFAIGVVKTRSTISKGKRPMLEVALKWINDRKEYWPISVRNSHYGLVHNPPLRHAAKPGSTYRNDRASSSDLSDLLVRARVNGLLPWEAIADETRPVRLWKTHRDSGGFVESELSDLLSNYWRDLLQSQPDHIEAVIEKNASIPFIVNLCAKYTIPLTSGRGQSSKTPFYKMAERFRASGKARLVLLVLSDFDPDGDCIATVNARTLRDDLGIPEHQIVPVRVAVRPDQIKKYNLPTALEAKESSKNYKRFTTTVYPRLVTNMVCLPIF